MTGRLYKKTIIVTGAGSGLGRASAIKLAEEGAQVFCVDVNPETVKETSDIIASEVELHLTFRLICALKLKSFRWLQKLKNL